MAQVLSHTPTNLVAEHFHLSEAHVLDIEVSAVDTLLHDFFRKTIQEWFEGTEIFQSGVTVIHDCLQERKCYASCVRPQSLQKINDDRY